MELTPLLHRARELHEWIVTIRRELHEWPELMYEEVRTSARVARELTALGIRFQQNVAKTGLVAIVGDGTGPCVALRADMDALPIHEETDVPFRSQVDNRMHACGHDCHTAMLLGAARLLKEQEELLPGTVKLVFQPAEEGGAGALRMCEQGVLENPTVQRMFGLHVWPYLPTGSIGSRAGALLASAGSLEIVVSGKGGHAAMPHTTIDPVVTMAAIITQLQTIVSRELDPLDSGVVSITTLRAGEAFNVIAPVATATGTIRSLSSNGLRALQERVRRIATHVGAAHECAVEVSFPGEDYPATVNDAALWRSATAIGREMLGPTAVQELAPIMGGEDFAYYAERVPSCFVALGVRNESIGASFGVHHPRFKVDEAALPIGAALHAGFAVRSLADLAALSVPA